MGWWRRLRRLDGDSSATGLDMNGRHVHTPGTFIDSWRNMPGGQPDDDRRPSVSELKGRGGTGDDRSSR